MLCGIDDTCAEEARRILTLCCFSERPLRVSELIDAIAVNLDEPVGLDQESRLQDSDSLLEICPGLIILERGADDTNEYLISQTGSGSALGTFSSEFSEKEDAIINNEPPDGQAGMDMTVRIAHFSVKEYLESGRIKETKAAAFALSRTAAHTKIAQLCCAYLLEPSLSNKLYKFPFAKYAANHWDHHYQNAMSETPELKTFVRRIFTQYESFYIWAECMESRFLPHVEDLNEVDIGYPLYYASILGLDWLLGELLATKMKARRVNARGGYYGSALTAASVGGYEKAVRILIDAGAEDVEGNFNEFGDALEAASYYGYTNIVDLLLDRGAETNTPKNRLGNALRAACHQGHEKIVQRLLDAGADANYEGDGFAYSMEPAIHLAAEGRHVKIVEMLLSAGADPNIRGMFKGSALEVAARVGHEKLVRVLLGAGADPNILGTSKHGALKVAAQGGHEKIVRMLLDAGAESKDEALE